MNKINPLVASFLILLLLNGCGTVVEGLSGSKKKGNEEFLVKKKAPLVLPPSYGELPKPGKKIDENLTSAEKDNSDIKEIIDQSTSNNEIKKNDSTNSSIEESVTEKIKNKKIKKINSEIELDKTAEEEKETTEKKVFLKDS